MAYEILVIGCPASSSHAALEAIVAEFPADFGIPVVVVAHGELSAAAALRDRSRLPVLEVEDKEFILPGRIHLAPTDYHLLVEPGSLALSTEAPVGGARPAIDALFESTADAYGERAIAVLMTCEGVDDDACDGMHGLARIRERGGVALTQPALPPVVPGAAGSR